MQPRQQACLLLILLSMAASQCFPGTEAEPCPSPCYPVDYITCTSSPNTKFPARCNCSVFANLHPLQSGCQLHLTDGTVVQC
ncbi:hypothetical protein KP509_18G022000 [Ceratopteris richardii]|uniref:Uncharacterized protein n=1 Tax=Ceratopteris richardii TaxID=49495 RepID=A0A8T2SN66_CERRI|nr:hypothetical protein KP509_18G022000 [Ceratopteris richardii]